MVYTVCRWCYAPVATLVRSGAAEGLVCCGWDGKLDRNLGHNSFRGVMHKTRGFQGDGVGGAPRETGMTNHRGKRARWSKRSGRAEGLES